MLGMCSCRAFFSELRLWLVLCGWSWGCQSQLDLRSNKSNTKKNFAHTHMMCPLFIYWMVHLKKGNFVQNDKNDTIYILFLWILIVIVIIFSGSKINPSVYHIYIFCTIKKLCLWKKCHWLTNSRHCVNINTRVHLLPQFYNKSLNKYNIKFFFAVIIYGHNIICTLLHAEDFMCAHLNTYAYFCLYIAVNLMRHIKRI